MNIFIKGYILEIITVKGAVTFTVTVTFNCRAEILSVPRYKISQDRCVPFQLPIISQIRMLNVWS